LTKPVSLLLAMSLLAAGLAQKPDNALEVETRSRGKYHADWPPGPLRDSMPSWAAPGKIRFSRWDGGRIETAKAFLSGWEGLNPPHPDLLYTMTNWYDLATVQLLKEAHINLIWITMSVGFSNETEAAHREDVRRYIAECHLHGIRVMAYQSVANIFWEDMFKVVPASKGWLSLLPNGQPQPYGAGRYEKMGRITRYLADLANPDWRTYLKKRIDLAIESGADGLMYDNGRGEEIFNVYHEMMQYAASRRRDFLVMANVHWSNFTMNRLLNAITTEDGLEPGLWSAKSPGYERLKSHYSYLMPIGDRLLVNNVGLLRIHETLIEGWKPAMIEDGHRERAGRLEALMSPQRSQLALAENMMYGVALEQFIEARPAHDLLTGEPETRASWSAIGKYNRFFEEHTDLYTGARSRASLAIVLDDRGDGLPLLDGLGARRVIFNVLYERDLSAETLSGYKAVAILSARVVRDSALAAVEEFVRKGGVLIAAGPAGSLDEHDRKRPRNPFATRRVDSGQSIYFDRLPAPDELAKTLLRASGEGLVHLEAPPGILYNVTEQRDRGRVLVHLLNYTLSPVADLDLKVMGTYRSARLVSPDGAASFAVAPVLGPAYAELRIPGLRIYSLVVLERK